MFTDLAAALLSFAKQVFGPDICPGEWVWATMTAGALIALLPIGAAVTVALIRKGTGNTYNPVTIGVFAAIGGVFVLLVPFVLMMGISEVFRAAYAVPASSGLTQGQLRSLTTTTCELVGNQRNYFGKGLNVFDQLFYPKGNKIAYGFYLGALVGLPALSAVFVMLQGRLALRRGPKWPGRLFWGPFVGLAVLSVALGANTAMHLWLGFLPVTILGLAPVALVGPPSWQAIRRADQRAAQRAAAQQPRPAPPVPAHQSAVRPLPPVAPVPPPPPPPKKYPPTALAGALPPPSSGPTSRYRRVRKLGHGGMGTVWEAVDTQLDRRVALKIAHAPDRETEQRMEREAKALAVVNHPNCVKVYDLVEEHDGLALVMQYLEGDALAFAVDTSGPIDDVAAARLWSTMAGALMAAHEKGVLHRDVKPSNVIVDPKGIPHLIDFGIARSKGDSQLTATGMMIGTPDYTAPETANGAAASPASDAWQLAATVSFALTGRPPRGTRENSMAALIAASRAEAPRELPQRSVHTRMLAAALDGQPRNRPTLQAVVAEMNVWLAGAGESQVGPVTRLIPRP